LSYSSMARYGQLIMGPAGCGKSTYTAVMKEHFLVHRKTVRCVNLDPAAEDFKYECDIDVRELISVDDVMEEFGYGPNGALMYCVEYLVENLDWLTEQLDEYGDDEYFLFDCPGQIELYSHVPVMRYFVEALQRVDIRLCGVYCVDALFMTDATKLIAGTLAALSTMMCLELPQVNLVTKCDLIEEEELESMAEILDADADELTSRLGEQTHPAQKAMNAALASVVDAHSLVRFITLNPDSEESLDAVWMTVNNCIQFGEDAEPRCDFDMGEKEEDD